MQSACRDMEGVGVTSAPLGSTPLADPRELPAQIVQQTPQPSKQAQHRSMAAQASLYWQVLLGNRGNPSAWQVHVANTLTAHVLVCLAQAM
jgi:hypothetical protein